MAYTKINNSDDRIVVIKKVCIKDRNEALKNYRLHKAAYDLALTENRFDASSESKKKMQFWAGRLSQVNKIYELTDK